MKRSSTLARLGVAMLATSLVAAGCGGGDGDDDKDGNGGSNDNASSAPSWYFVDGNTADYSSDFDEGTLEGVRATYPGSDLGDEFRERLLGVNPDLADFTYGAESYDAVVVAALAAIAAGNDSGTAIASELQNVSAGGEKCTDFAACSELLAAGTDIDYDGVSGPIDFSSTGSPTSASIGIFQYAADNTYSSQEFITGEIPDTDPVEGQELPPIADGDGVFTVGGLLPTSGDLAFLGPPEIAGVALAVQEINEAGGVNGAQAVNLPTADSGDGTPDIAGTSVDQLLAGDVDVIVGAASSSVSLSVIDKITSAGVVQISPANTSTAFDTYKDQGLYFRTAPSDVLQGQVMASTLIGDGKQNIAILARQDSYGEALATNVRDFFTQAGGNVVSYQLYSPEAATYTAEVEALKAEDPDAIVLISFDETKKIVPELVEAGLNGNN